MITNTILYMALIVVAILFLHSIKDNISTEGLKKAIGNGVLSPKRIMRWCKNKGFETDIDEDGLIILADENSIQYCIAPRYPNIFVVKGGEIRDEIDREKLKEAIDEYNNSVSMIKVTLKNDRVSFIASTCCPVPGNFHKAFDYHLSMLERAEEAIASTYLDMKNEPENPS